MVVRSQISLDPELLRRAKERAADLGISLAEYIRRLVAQDTERPRPAADPSQVFDLGDSGGSDIGRLKDEYVGEAVETQQRDEVARRRA